jgi:hypothetical protein
MKKLFLIFFLLLSSCSISPEIPKFPDVPSEITEKCPDLLLVKEGETKLSETLKVITENYGLYHSCQIKTETWIEWYKQQKSIYESIK